jgi:anti-anti-sigma factor
MNRLSVYPSLEGREPVPVFEISPLVDEAGLKLAGELDLATVPQLKEALRDFAPTDPVRLDLGELTFLDSTGLHAILALARSRRGDGSVVLVDASPAVVRILEIIDIERHAVIEVQSSEVAPGAA